VKSKQGDLSIAADAQCIAITDTASLESSASQG